MKGAIMSEGIREATRGCGRRDLIRAHAGKRHVSHKTMDGASIFEGA